MTAETNKSTETELKTDKTSVQTGNSASQLPAHSEEMPVVRKLVVPEQSSTPSEPDDDRSPGLVGRSVGEALEQKTTSTEKNSPTSEEPQSESK